MQGVSWPPVEALVNGYPACRWPLQAYPPAAMRRGLFDLLVTEEVQGQGFTEAVAVTDGLERRIELLGPDSPGEYVYTFDRRLIDVRWLDDLTRDLIWWIRRMGTARKVMSNGK